MEFIYAKDLNGGIGKDGDMPWSFKEDFKHFKAITTKREIGDSLPVVIMGKTTYDSLPTVLKDRYSVVLSSKCFSVANGEVVHSIDELNYLLDFEFSSLEERTPVYCIGGASVYKSLINQATKLHVTIVGDTFDCDAFVPNFEDDFIEFDSKTIEDTNRNTGKKTNLTFKTYIRKEVK